MINFYSLSLHFLQGSQKFWTVPHTDQIYHPSWVLLFGTGNKQNIKFGLNKVNLGKRIFTIISFNSILLITDFT